MDHNLKINLSYIIPMIKHEKIYNLWLGKYFWDTLPTASSIKEKWWTGLFQSEKYPFFKDKSLQIFTDTTDKIERQAIEGEKIFE